MLAKHSLQYYLDNLKRKQMSLDNLKSSIQSRFEPAERTLALIR